MVPNVGSVEQLPGVSMETKQRSSSSGKGCETIFMTYLGDLQPWTVGHNSHPWSSQRGI